MYPKTQQKAERILALYREGKSVSEIIEAEKPVPVSKKTVKKILASYGIDYTAELAIKEAAKPAQVVEMYKAGRSLLEIEAELRLTYTTVRDILKTAGIQQRTLSQQGVIKHGNTIDEFVFDEINEESAYWIGLLYADGHVRREKWYGVEITLHLDDIELLYKFGKFLKSNKEPIKVTNTNCAKFIIGCQRIHQRLTGLGFTPDKSYTGVPHEELKHNRDFWRGVIDGDGCLWSAKGWSSNYGYRRIISVCGTEATCIGFMEFVLENGIESKATVRSIKGESTWTISYEGVIADYIAELLYGGSKIYMERKYKKYMEYFAGSE